MQQISSPIRIGKIYRSRMLAQVLLAVFFLACRFVDGRKLQILTLVLKGLRLILVFFGYRNVGTNVV